jgi:hypothetical protein
MVIDPLASRGVTIEPASAATLAQLAGAGIEVKPARLVDLTIAGARYQTMKATLDILLAAPEFDLVLAVVGSSARAQPEMTVRPIIDSAGAGKPLAAFLAPDAPEALAALEPRGRAEFPHARGLRRRDRRRAGAAPPRRFASCARGRRAGEATAMLDELAAGRCSSASASRGAVGRARCRHRQAPPLPFPLSGRGQASLRRDRAQERRRRRRARRRRRRRAARRDPEIRTRVAERSPAAASPGAGAAHGVRLGGGPVGAIASIRRTWERCSWWRPAACSR